MVIEVKPGDFEMAFSNELASRIASGESLSVELVRNCYAQSGDSLGLSKSGADELHISDVFKTLSGLGTPIVKMKRERLSKLVFDLIYMH